jgi:transposase
MDTELSLTNERVDDIPLILAVARRLRLPEILDEQLGNHGNQQGLSNGWLATLWVAYILSENDHRKSVVQDWASSRRLMLQRLTGRDLRDTRLSDDRLGNLLRRLAEPSAWQGIEAALWRQSAFVYALECERVRLDSTTSYG